ncbi:MAG: sulfurtransferase TusA family protein [Acetobacter sp.]|nr:sulfurtransferase TusA family protein [Acetobacter sp.]MBQ5469164.1 sulfurtransferase TusA family protein [Acetobacter sp.]MBQ5478626.1 sulfurtransferase TusA family protein [Acetobacter sp.]MBQ5515542.1 sulfurtransferase TusA family protein [Acetobacter sp.]MBQ5546554.1 sulfurtransferase TusA family protein [Acetobacter sp.]
MTTITLDVRNLRCPLPVLKAHRKLREMAPGERLHVLVTDPASLSDFQIFCRETGHTLIACNHQSGTFSFTIRRRVESPTQENTGKREKN